MKLQEAKDHLAEIGERQARKELQEKRERVGLNQLDLSKLSRVKQSNINRIESGKQGITPRTFSKLMTAIERLSADRTSAGEIAAARKHVKDCETLPWFRSGLGAAKARLAELELAAHKHNDILNDPIVKAVMESYERETEAYKAIVEQLVPKMGMQIADLIINREPRAVEAYRHFKETGEVLLKPVIDKIEKVEG